MTTAAEAIIRTECADLRTKLQTAERRIVDLEGCKFRLNGLIVARDVKIAELHDQLSKAYAELDALRAGELPY